MVWEHPATSSMSSVRLVTNGRFCSGSPLDDRPDHAVANDAGAVAVVLHLVEPAVADRRLWAGGGEVERDGRGVQRPSDVITARSGHWSRSHHVARPAPQGQNLREIDNGNCLGAVPNRSAALGGAALKSFTLLA